MTIRLNNIEKYPLLSGRSRPQHHRVLSEEGTFTHQVDVRRGKIVGIYIENIFRKAQHMYFFPASHQL